MEIQSCKAVSWTGFWGNVIKVELTKRLSCVRSTATPASTLPTVRETNILGRCCELFLSLRKTSCDSCRAQGPCLGALADETYDWFERNSFTFGDYVKHASNSIFACIKRFIIIPKAV